LLTGALSEFITQNPNCKVELRTGLVHELRTMLERGQINLVFGPQTLADPLEELVFTPIIDDRVGVVCRTDHPLTKRAQIMASDLMSESWLAHSRGSLLRQQTESAMAQSGVRHMNIICETDSIRTALEILSSTDLISTMPKASTEPYLGSSLVFLNFDNPQFHRPLGVISRQNTLETPVVDGFLKFLTADIGPARRLTL